MESVDLEQAVAVSLVVLPLTPSSRETTFLSNTLYSNTKYLLTRESGLAGPICRGRPGVAAPSVPMVIWPWLRPPTSVSASVLAFKRSVKLSSMWQCAYPGT